MTKQLFALVLTVFFTPLLSAELVHRYSFNDGDTRAVDSVGEQDGTLVGGAVMNSHAVHLTGNGAYVDLPGAGIAINTFQELTLEMWSTQPEMNQGYSMTVALGGTWPSGVGKNYLMLCTTRGDDVSRAALALTPDADAPWSDEIGVNGPELNDGLEHQYVLTVGAEKLAFYIDGLLQGTVALGGFSLSGVSAQYAYLGKSVYTNDATVQGSIDEFRIYDNALSPQAVLSSYQKGPDATFTVYKAHTPWPADQSDNVPLTTTLSWRPPDDTPTSTTLYIGTTPDLNDAQVIEVGDTNQVNPKLHYETTYYWQVLTHSPLGTYPSAIWSFTTMAAPLNVASLGDLNGDFQIDWRDVALFARQWLHHDGCTGLGCADLDGEGGVDWRDFAGLAGHWMEAFPRVVINEIHYHPDNNKETVEFVELVNPSTRPVDLSDWSFEGITYTFPAGTMLSSQGYLVIAQDPNACEAKFGVTALGPFGGKLSNDGEDLVLLDRERQVVDEVDYGTGFPWPTAADGEGASMELLNPGLDNNLAGSWRSSGSHTGRPESAFGRPTPGRRNQVYSSHVPPQIRQVHNSPPQPRSDEPVVVTAKVTDVDGVRAVTLKLQVVPPGEYLPAYLPIAIPAMLANPYQSQPRNPDFEDAAHWSELAMTDDGTGADAVAGDHVYTALIPAQDNRTLVRYRVVAEDGRGNVIQVPYADDPSLNFAYYVYDGVPDYVATQDTVEPDGPGHVYPPRVLTSLPVYTLITRAEDLYQCNGYNAADRLDQGSTSVVVQDAGRVYNWEGAFVYDGEVYDHIGYRLRGGNGRYNYNSFAGKRSMKFRFNRGHYFQARDIYGHTFPSRWQHLNTGKMFGNQILFAGYNRYPYGLNEVMDMRLFQAANVPAPAIWWMHFRVVDGPDEAPAGPDGQYRGDFWGLYLAFENYDGDFLKRLGLPKGNLYKLSDKIYDGPRQLRYQGPRAVDDASDYENIRWNLNHTATADYIRTFVDCDEWYRYHTVTEAIRHYDIFSGPDCFHCLKNSAWYFYPEYSLTDLGKLQFLPFDVDDTWGPYFNQGVDHAKAAIYDQRYVGGLEQFPIDPNKAPLKQEYRNAIREFRDLQWQPDVINGMIDELAAVIRDFVPADRDRWRLDHTVPGNPMDNGPLDECVSLMKQFAWKSGGFPGGFYWVGSAQNLDNLAGAGGDATSIPDTPIINYVGTQGYPINDLWFYTSAFSDPQGNNTFAAMKWRIAAFHLNDNGTSDASIEGGPENTTPLTQRSALQPGQYEMKSLWQSEEVKDPSDRLVHIPAQSLQVGQTYRVRCRMKDETGRWSHWSQPIEFVAGPPLGYDLLNDLRVSELMYHPSNDPNGRYDDGDFEYIELKNISEVHGLDLNSVSLTGGVTFSFAGSHVTHLDPGACVLVVRNQAAFISRYGSAVGDRIAGTYSGALSNGGERIVISDTWNGTLISFTYNDHQGWPQAADGKGASLAARTDWTRQEIEAGILDNPQSWSAGEPTPGW